MDGTFLSLFGNSPRFSYKRNLFQATDGGTIALDWLMHSDVVEGISQVVDGSTPGTDRTPIAIVVPGLTSDSTAAYIKNLAFKLAKEGWNVVVQNHRGLGGISLTEIAVEVQSESKWKQLGELAMSSGKLQMAEECMKYAMDLSGLLLLYSSLGDAEGLTKLATLAKEQGKNNVAFLCLFMLGKLEDCLELLVESNRIPEAALMARSYFPSKVSEIVALWRKDLSKVNSKAAESLADPEEYPNLFEDWQVALSVEARALETRGVYTAAENYPSHAEKSSMTLVEAFRNLQVEEEESFENGDIDHEEVVAEENGDEQKNDEDVVEHDEEKEEEEGIVDGDSTDGAVLVNGSEADEEWGTNNEGNPSA